MSSYEDVSPLRGSKVNFPGQRLCFPSKEKSPERLVSYTKALLPLLLEKTKGAMNLDADVLFRKVFLLGIVNYRNCKLQGVAEPELCSKKLLHFCLTSLGSAGCGMDFAARAS